jgi:hypothetical protein
MLLALAVFAVPLVCAWLIVRRLAKQRKRPGEGGQT